VTDGDTDTGVPPVVARLRQRIKDREEPQALVAFAGGGLLVRYKRRDLEWGEFLALFDQAQSPDEQDGLKANLDLVARCCHELLVRTDDGDLLGLHTVLGEDTPYRFDERGLHALGIDPAAELARLGNPLKPDTVRGMVLAVFAAIGNAGMPQTVVGAHAEQITHMLQGTSREVGADLLPPP
jgi:hypothetical protein